MQTGQVMSKYQLTRDHLRFYIKVGLLQPQLVKGKYDWSESDIADLENILELRQLGLSVKAIVRIKALHESACGTEEQLLENRQVLLDEIENRATEIAVLQQQKLNLEHLLVELESRLAEKS